MSTKIALWPRSRSALHTEVPVTSATWRSVEIPPPRTTIFKGDHFLFINYYTIPLHAAFHKKKMIAGREEGEKGRVFALDESRRKA